MKLVAMWLLSGLLASAGAPPLRHTVEPRPMPVETRQERRWREAQVRPEKVIQLDKAVWAFERTRARYEAVERMRAKGVPAPVVFVFHNRESSLSFSRHLHEGGLLQHRTRDVPRGRPLTPHPPYTWERSAEDALYIYEADAKKFRAANWRDTTSALDAMTSYNGWGYDKYHPEVPTPYLWAGTSLYSRGKYVADGKFSYVAVDAQLGCCAILKRMIERGLKVPWAGAGMDP